MKYLHQHKGSNFVLEESMSNRNQNAPAVQNSNRISKINSLNIDQINMDGSRARLNNSPDVAGDFGL